MDYNKLIMEYRNGDDSAFDELCKAILPTIEKKADELWGLLDNPHSFNCRCLMRLKRALLNHDTERGSFGTLAHHVIKQEFADYIKRRNSRSDELLSGLTARDEEGTETQYEISDVRYDPGTVTGADEGLKEKITLLAKGDQRKTLTLSYWSEGMNDSELSVVLANNLGGKPEGHRSFIKRFRNECRQRLAI